MSKYWEASKLGLTRTFSFRRYDSLQTFVEELMRQAVINDHHPTVTFNYSSVTVTFITHDAGNTITELDTNSALILDTIFEVIPQR